MRQAEDDPGELPVLARDPDELDREAARVTARENELSSELELRARALAGGHGTSEPTARTRSDVKRIGSPRSSVRLLIGVKDWHRLDRTGQFAAESWRGRGRRNQPIDRCSGARPLTGPTRRPGRSPHSRPRSPASTPVSIGLDGELTRRRLRF